MANSSTNHGMISMRTGDQHMTPCCDHLGPLDRLTVAGDYEFATFAKSVQVGATG